MPWAGEGGAEVVVEPVGRTEQPAHGAAAHEHDVVRVARAVPQQGEQAASWPYSSTWSSPSSHRLLLHGQRPRATRTAWPRAPVGSRPGVRSDSAPDPTTVGGPSLRSGGIGQARRSVHEGILGPAADDRRDRAAMMPRRRDGGEQVSAGPDIGARGPGAAEYGGRLTAAWPSGLGKGLQSPVRRFDSGRRLQQGRSGQPVSAPPGPTGPGSIAR